MRPKLQSHNSTCPSSGGATREGRRPQQIFGWKIHHPSHCRQAQGTRLTANWLNVGAALALWSWTHDHILKDLSGNHTANGDAARWGGGAPSGSGGGGGRCAVPGRGRPSGVKPGTALGAAAAGVAAPVPGTRERAAKKMHRNQRLSLEQGHATRDAQGNLAQGKRRASQRRDKIVN